jgi:hypothetical protein
VRGPAARPVPTATRVVRGWLVLVNRESGRSWMDKLKAPGKPFDISKWEVQEAYEKVKAK